jgi:hypothetical protein
MKSFHLLNGPRGANPFSGETCEKNGGPEAMANKQHTSGCQERLSPTKTEGYSGATLKLTEASSSSLPGLGLKAKPTGETIPVVAK